MKRPLSSLLQVKKIDKSSRADERLKILEKRLERAIAERRKLAAGESSAADQLKKIYAKRGGMVERKIGRLQNETKKR